MPPRRSERRKRPSTQALESNVSASRRRNAQPTAPDPPVVSSVTDALPSEGTPALPPGFLEQLVASVTASVTRNIINLLPGPQGSAANPPQAQRPSTTEVPLASTHPLPMVPSTAVLDPVQGAIHEAQSVITGESRITPSLPHEVFRSVSMPVDARVGPKIKAKIWGEEFIDFGSLLVNPVLDRKFQLTVQSGEGGTQPFTMLRACC